MAYKYRSIYPSILLHLAYNLAATLLGASAQILPDTMATQAVLVVVMIVADGCQQSGKAGQG